MKASIFTPLLLIFLIFSCSLEAQVPQKHLLDSECEVALQSLIKEVRDQVKEGCLLKQIMQKAKNFKSSDLASANPEVLIKLTYDLLLQGYNEQEVLDALLKYLDEEALKQAELQKNDTSKYVKWAIGGVVVAIVAYLIHKVVDRYRHRYDPARHDHEYEGNQAQYEWLQNNNYNPDFDAFVARMAQELGNINLNRMSPLQLDMFRARCHRFEELLRRSPEEAFASVNRDRGWGALRDAMGLAADQQRAENFLWGSPDNYRRLLAPVH